MDGDGTAPAGQIFRPEAIEAYEAGQSDTDVLTTITPRTGLALGIFLALAAALSLWLWFGSLDVAVTARGTVAEPAAFVREIAPLDGVMIRVDARAGDALRAGDVLGYLRTPGGSVVGIRAHAAGIVANALPGIGSFLRRGDPVADLAPTREPRHAVVFVPADEARIVLGAQARVRIGGVLETPLRAHVVAIDPTPANAERVHALAPLLADGASAVREVDLALDETNATLVRGAPVTATVVVGGRAPIKAFFSSETARGR